MTLISLGKGLWFYVQLVAAVWAGAIAVSVFIRAARTKAGLLRPAPQCTADDVHNQPERRTARRKVVKQLTVRSCARVGRSDRGWLLP